MAGDPAGGWLLAAVTAAIFIVFAFGFVRPRSGRDWRAFGAFSAFLVALFTEMYGVALSVYLVAGWLEPALSGGGVAPGLTGHVPGLSLGGSGTTRRDLYLLLGIHVAGFAMIIGGFALLAAAWRVLHRAHRAGELAQSGPYAFIRHPQYVAFVLIMAGVLVQWPTPVTLVMFPVLVVMYRRLALREEGEVEGRLGADYRRYAARVPRFAPRLRTAPPESCTGATARSERSRD